MTTAKSVKLTVGFSLSVPRQRSIFMPAPSTRMVKIASLTRCHLAAKVPNEVRRLSKSHL